MMNCECRITRFFVVHVATSEPSRVGDGSEAVRNMVTPEPSPVGWWGRYHGVCGDTGALHTGRWIWSRGTREDTGALSQWVACPMPCGTWRSQSSLASEAGLEPRGHTAAPQPSLAGRGIWCRGAGLKSCARGYPVWKVPIISTM
jgi:hypothetical protein